MWMSAQLTVQFDKKANVAVISLMKNMLHLFVEIHAVLSQSIQQIDVIHSNLHSIFSKYMATEFKKCRIWESQGIFALITRLDKSLMSGNFSLRNLASLV